MEEIMKKIKLTLLLAFSILALNTAIYSATTPTFTPDMVDVFIKAFLTMQYKSPTLNIDSSKKSTYISHISYKDYANKVVDFGDWEALAVCQNFTFKSGRIAGVQDVILYKNNVDIKDTYNLSYSSSAIRIEDRNNPELPKVYQYSVSPKNYINITSGVVEYNYEIDSTGTGYTVFHYNFQGIKEKNLEVSIKESGITIKEEDTGITWEYSPSGILTRQVMQGATYEYTVTEGEGALKKDGAVAASLTRTVDASGYLTYELVKYPDGRAEEYFIGPSLPNITGHKCWMD